MFLLLLALAAANPGRHVLFFVEDGLRPDTFHEALSSGRLPNHQRLLADATEYTNARTVFPSVTLPANASLITGRFPSEHGIPGNHWFNPEAGEEVDYMTPLSMACVYGFTLFDGRQCAGGLANSHLRVPTVYETLTAANLTSFVSFHPYWRGATRFRSPTILEALSFWDGKDIKYDVLDRRMMAHAIDLLESEGQPNLFTLYFAGTDGTAHEAGLAAEADYLADVVDPLIGQFLDTLDAIRPGWRDDTKIILTSDHGRTYCEPTVQDLTLPLRIRAVLATSGVSYRLIPNGPVVYIYLEEVTEESRSLLADRLRQELNGAAVAATEGEMPFGFYSDRAPQLLVTLPEGQFYGGCHEVTGHGSNYDDDRKVPLYIATPGEVAGIVEDEISTTSVVHTILRWLGVAIKKASTN